MVCSGQGENVLQLVVAVLAIALIKSASYAFGNVLFTYLKGALSGRMTQVEPKPKNGGT